MPENFTTDTIKQLDQAKASGKPTKMQVYFLHGIYGEMQDCNGIAEEVIDNDEKLTKHGLDPADGGTFVKIWGCSYLYRGNPAMGQVFGMEQAKSMVSEIPRGIIGKSALLSTAMLLLFLFARKRFISYAHRYFNSIRQHSVRLYSPPEERMGRPVREIRRAMAAALAKELGPDIDPELGGLLTDATNFGTLIMEMDCAYRFPLQDILGEVDRENAARSGYREAMRLFDILLARQTNLTIVPGISERDQGVPYKFRFLKKLARVALLVSPRARRITQNFLIELDPAKVGLDESDWYFCLRRNTHNYRGVPLPERLAELARLDKEKRHQYIKFEYKGFHGQV